MLYKRRSRSKKLFISFSKGIGVVVLILLTVVAIGLLLRSYLTKEKVASQKAPVQVALAEIPEPPDASSEISGKYYGLCKKNSIHSVEDFRRTVQNDAVLAAHFSGFNWEAAKLGKQDKDIWTFVSYRKGEIIRRTSKPVRLPKGDGYISDGARTVRTFCCNDYEIAPPPVKVSLAPVPETVDGPPRRMANKSDTVAGPPRQLAYGAASEDSAGSIPESFTKIPYYPEPPQFYSRTVLKQYTSNERTVVTPEPGTFYLMWAGIAGFGLFRIFRRKQATQK